MKIDFKKGNGLVPVIIQDVKTAQVLMLAYMNEAAYVKTREDNKVCFYSRSKERLWTKGETSGNYLVPKEIFFDCDQDTILIKVQALGPACHLGTKSCFKNNEPIHFLAELEQIINDRTEQPIKSSYTRKLLEQGINKVSQKFGEEAVELIIEAMDHNKENFLNESADMLYHFMVLLKAKEVTLQEVMSILQERNTTKEQIGIKKQ